MKKLLFLAIALIAFSCTKQASIKPAPVKEEMTVAQVRARFHIDLTKAEAEYYASFPAARRGGKKLTEETVVVVWFDDLTISEADGIITCTVSPNAYVAGVTNFSSTTSNDGAVGIWECNRYYDTPPGAGSVTTCHTIGAGFIRGFSCDFITYDTHVSGFHPVN